MTFSAEYLHHTGENLERWLKSRRKLLESDAVCDVFTNKFMRRLGLDRLVDP